LIWLVSIGKLPDPHFTSPLAPGLSKACPVQVDAPATPDVPVIRKTAESLVGRPTSGLLSGGFLNVTRVAPLIGPRSACQPWTDACVWPLTDTTAAPLTTKDVGTSKNESARRRIEDLNPHVHVETYETLLTSQNALGLFKDYDVILDGTDNFPTRYLVNDACVLTGKPNAYGSIFRFEGQASVFATKDGPCYRCLYPEPPPPGLVPSCAEGGVLGVLPGIIGVIQATETIKLITGIGEPLIGRFLIYDALRMKFRELKLRKDPECPVCGTNPTVTKLIDYEQFCGLRPEPQQAAQGGPSVSDWEITPVELKKKMDAGETPLILDVREPNEYQINKIAGSTLIPLGELPRRYQELPRDREIIAQCKMGGRSAKAMEFLKTVGFTNVKNLRGGILEWIDKVDPSQPKY